MPVHRDGCCGYAGPWSVSCQWLAVRLRREMPRGSVAVMGSGESQTRRSRWRFSPLPRCSWLPRCSRCRQPAWPRLSRPATWCSRCSRPPVISSARESPGSSTRPTRASVTPRSGLSGQPGWRGTVRGRCRILGHRSAHHTDRPASRPQVHRRGLHRGPLRQREQPGQADRQRLGGIRLDPAENGRVTMARIRISHCHHTKGSHASCQ